MDAFPNCMLLQKVIQYFVVTLQAIEKLWKASFLTQNPRDI